GVLVADAK
nr:aminopeptidase B [Saccharomyces cerevisiae, Peptide Partial, 8 aa] [Saccharomyces cerevisiae]